MSPIAIHHGNHGTYEPAGTTIIEQHSRQQTTKQVVVRKFQIRKTETTEAMTRMKRIQRSKPTVISHLDSKDLMLLMLLLWWMSLVPKTNEVPGKTI